MTPQQAAALATHLDRLVADLQEGRVSDPLHSVLVGVYGSPGPAPSQ